MEDFTVWTTGEGKDFKVCKEGFNHPVLYEHLVELPLDLAEIISETSRGLGAEEGFTSLRRGMSGVVSCCVF